MLNIPDHPKSSYKPPPWSGIPRTPLYIDVIRDGSIIQQHVLEGKSFFIIGSAPTVDIVYQNPLISPEHAVIQFNSEGDSTITDLYSEHGSWTNDVTISPGQYLPLASGDRMVFGVKSSRRSFIVRESADPAYAPEVCRTIATKQQPASKPPNSEVPESPENPQAELLSHDVNEKACVATPNVPGPQQQRRQLFNAKGKVSSAARTTLQLRRAIADKRDEHLREIDETSEEPYASWGMHDVDDAIRHHQAPCSAVTEAKRWILCHVDPATGFLDVSAIKKSQPTMAALSASQLSTLSKIAEIQREMLHDEDTSVSTDDEQLTTQEGRRNRRLPRNHAASPATMSKDLDLMIRQLAGCSASRDLRRYSCGTSSSEDEDDSHGDDDKDGVHPIGLSQAARDAVENRLFDEDDDFFDRSRANIATTSTVLSRGSKRDIRNQELHGRILQMEKQLAQLDSEIAEGERRQLTRDPGTTTVAVESDRHDSVGVIADDKDEDSLDMYMKVNEAILQDANLKSLRLDRNEAVKELEDLKQAKFKNATPAVTSESSVVRILPRANEINTLPPQGNSKAKSNRAVRTASSVLSQIVSSKETAKKIKIKSMIADVNEGANDEPWGCQRIT